MDASTRNANQEKLEELQAIVRGYRCRIQCVESDMSNDVHFNRRTERLEATIAKAKKELDTLKNNRTNGFEIIAECRKQIKRLKKRMIAVQRAADIEKLLELQSKIKELQGSLHPCETLFLYGNRREVPCGGVAAHIIHLEDGSTLAVCESCKRLTDEAGGEYPYNLKGKALKIWLESQT